MKGLIIYKGTYGATQQYASWLADELQVPAMPVQEFNSSQLNSCDFVIIAASVYIGKWQLKEWVQQNKEFYNDKKIFYLVVCGTPSSEPQKQAELVKTNFPAGIGANAELFFLPGRVIIKKLSWKHRMLLRIGAMMEKDPVQKQAMQHDVDNVKKEMLLPVINRVMEFAGDQLRKSTILPRVNTAI